MSHQLECPIRDCVRHSELVIEELLCVLHALEEVAFKQLHSLCAVSLAAVIKQEDVFDFLLADALGSGY